MTKIAKPKCYDSRDTRPVLVRGNRRHSVKNISAPETLIALVGINHYNVEITAMIFENRQSCLDFIDSAGVQMQDKNLTEEVCDREIKKKFFTRYYGDDEEAIAFEIRTIQFGVPFAVWSLV